MLNTVWGRYTKITGFLLISKVFFLSLSDLGEGIT